MYGHKNLRAYLLGEEPETEHREMDRQLRLVPALAEALELAEEELIEDYTEGRLLPAEIKEFEQFFLRSAEHRKKLTFAGVFLEWITSRKPSIWSMFRKRFR